MATLLIAEHDDKSLNGATAKSLTAAKALGADVHILVAGAGCLRASRQRTVSIVGQTRWTRPLPGQWESCAGTNCSGGPVWPERPTSGPRSLSRRRRSRYH